MTGRTFVGALALLLAAGATALAGAPALDPARTFVFSASIVEWPEAAGLASFTDERRDGALLAAFGAAGVSSDNIVFLKDAQATRAAMRKELRALATRAGEGSTLVFCFQGHGDRKDGETYLMCYDVKEDVKQTAFAVSEIAPILDECWKGDRLILLGDCCHSGALARVVRHYEGTRVKAASFTSATASNRSTEHWTFTDAFIEAMNGDGRLDRDHDGSITFAETDRWIHEAMKYREGQLTHATRTASFEADFALHAVAKAPGEVPGEIFVGDYVDALDQEKKWYVAQVLGWKDGKYRVHYVGWDAKWDEDVERDRLRTPPTATALEIGGRYEVEWDPGQWYPGTVTRAEEGWFYFVHYEGEDGQDDEWITPGRARPPTPPEFRALAPVAAKKGDRVAARWRQQWFLATVAAVKPKVVDVLYDDGSKARVTTDELVVVASASELAEGERVLACWNDGSQMYPGTLVKKGDKTCSVQWEDGSETTAVPVGKIARVKKK